MFVFYYFHSMLRASLEVLTLDHVAESSLAKILENFVIYSVRRSDDLVLGEDELTLCADIQIFYLNILVLLLLD